MRVSFGLKFLSILLLSSALSGCSGGNFFGEDKIDPTVPAEQLYNEGLALSNQKRFSGAAKKFDELNKQHAYSDYARKGTVLAAYNHHAAGSYDDAALAATRYLTLYSGGEDSAYMRFILADSYYRQIPTIERDQSGTEKALRAMQELVTLHPKSEYVSQIKPKIEFAKDQLAGKEMDIGRYYLAKKDYLAAINRFKTVVSQYQTTRHVEEALYRLVEANLALGIVSEAQAAASVLGHNFPKSPWYTDAYKLLQAGGTSPKEDAGSWMTKALSGRF